jgi:hypothetical protein
VAPADRRSEPTFDGLFENPVGEGDSWTVWSSGATLPFREPGRPCLEAFPSSEPSQRARHGLPISRRSGSTGAEGVDDVGANPYEHHQHAAEKVLHAEGRDLANPANLMAEDVSGRIRRDNR